MDERLALTASSKTSLPLLQKRDWGCELSLCVEEGWRLMAEYTQVKAELWQDPEFEGLSPSARLLWLNLLTTPTRNTAGLYRMSIGRMAFETGLDRETVAAGLAALCELEWIWWDEKTSLLWVRNFVRRQPGGPMLIPRLLKDLDGVGAHPFVAAFREYYADTLSVLSRVGTQTDPTPSARLDEEGTRAGLGPQEKEGPARLVELCRSEIIGWAPDPKDAGSIRRGLARLSMADCERIILELAAYQEEKPAKSRYKNPRLALDKWFAKEAPAQQPRAQPWAEEEDPQYPDVKIPEGLW
jgi:hypothetical protein